MNDQRDDSGLWTLHGFVELAVCLGLISGAAFSAALGQLLLALILAAMAAGVFLRFKRRSKTRWPAQAWRHLVLSCSTLVVACGAVMHVPGPARLIATTFGIAGFSSQTANAKPPPHTKRHAMDEKQFWSLVEDAKARSGTHLDRRPAALEQALSALPLEDIQAFQRRYEQLLIKANSWKLWAAAHIMNGGCSDDGFRYFRDWLISEGKALFERAIEDPDSLSSVPRREYFDLESFGYAALRAFEKKGGGELERDFRVEMAQPTGEEWQEGDLPTLLPRLSAKYLPQANR